jgi:serine-type D-Ala-D-Ala carboxypeptidase (penicillin-binding protein 5/6)
MQDRKQAHLIFLLVVVAFFSSFYFSGLYWREATEMNIARELQEKGRQQEILFSVLPLSAKSVIVYDTTSDKIIYAKNPFEPRPLASLAKLATAFVSLERLDISKSMLVNSNTQDTFGVVQFLSGENWNAGDLIDVLLLTSSNNAAEVLTDVAPTIDYFPRLRFMNASGLDEIVGEGKIPGATGSAYDIARLAGRFARIYPEHASVTAREFSDFTIGTRVYRAQNTNEWISKMPDLAISKTGYTDLAGGNLLVGYYTKEGNLIIIVVLGSTKEGRFEDTEMLLRTSRTLFP